MKKGEFLKITIILSLAALVFYLFCGNPTKSRAQQLGPRFFATWQAFSYAPSSFSGKVMPISNSPIAVSFELIDPATGKLIDVRNQTVYWYINDKFFKGGQGIQSIFFRLPTRTSGIIDVRIQLPSFRNELQLKTIKIPIVRPEAVIEAPYADNKFQSTFVQLTGVPYFFNTKAPSALNFRWTVNGEAPPNAENPEVLGVNLNPDAPAGSSLNVSLTIQNPANISETAIKNINLIFSPNK